MLQVGDIVRLKSWEELLLLGTLGDDKEYIYNFDGTGFRAPRSMYKDVYGVDLVVDQQPVKTGGEPSYHTNRNWHIIEPVVDIISGDNGEFNTADMSLDILL